MSDDIKVLKHDLVPEHRVLSREETMEVLRKYKVKKALLPKIKSTDPAIQHLKFTLGDVIEITRESPTAGVTKYWRVVIK